MSIYVWANPFAQTGSMILDKTFVGSKFGLIALQEIYCTLVNWWVIIRIRSYPFLSKIWINQIAWDKKTPCLCLIMYENTWPKILSKIWISDCAGNTMQRINRLKYIKFYFIQNLDKTKLAGRNKHPVLPHTLCKHTAKIFIQNLDKQEMQYNEYAEIILSKIWIKPN